MKKTVFFKLSALLSALMLVFISVPSFAAKTEVTPETKALYLVNELRLKEGLYPVSSFELLEKLAEKRAGEITTNFDHTRPDGSKWHSILKENNVNYQNAAENIAAGYSTPEEVVIAWENSASHREAMLDSSLSHLGIGHRQADDEYKDYWVQLFVGGCTIKSIRVETVDPDISYAVGTTIGEIAGSMKYRVVGECDMHGEFSLPLNAGMCTGYNSSRLGKQQITVMCYGLTAKLTIDLKSGDPFIMGDVNSNGAIDSGDATLVLRYTVGLITDKDLNTDTADMNENGKIDTGDATLIMRIVVS